MPIYEYACRACGHEFEEWQKISDKPIRSCPSCKKRKVEKLVSMSSFQLKGGGWYADGYASTNGKSKDASSTSDSSSSDASSKSDSSSKAEPKAKKASGSTGKTSSATSASSKAA